MLDVLQNAGVDEDGRPRWVKLSKIAVQRNWYRKFGGSLLKRVIASVSTGDGPVIAKYRMKKSEYEGGGMVIDKSSPTGDYRLKGASDDDDSDDEI